MRGAIEGVPLSVYRKLGGDHIAGLLDLLAINKSTVNPGSQPLVQRVKRCFPSHGPARAPSRLDIEALTLHYGRRGISQSLFSKIVVNGFGHLLSWDERMACPNTPDNIDDLDQIEIWQHWYWHRVLPKLWVNWGGNLDDKQRRFRYLVCSLMVEEVADDGIHWVCEVPLTGGPQAIMNRVQCPQLPLATTTSTISAPVPTPGPSNIQQDLQSVPLLALVGGQDMVGDEESRLPTVIQDDNNQGMRVWDDVYIRTMLLILALQIGLASFLFAVFRQ